MNVDNDVIDLKHLEKCNQFTPFDSNVSFHEYYTVPGTSEVKNHIYLVNNVIYDFTATTFVHSFFPSFDADLVIKKMMKGKNWTQSKYYGKSAEEIKDGWEENRLVASELGTEMHAMIEKFYNHPTLWQEKNKKKLEAELSKYYAADKLEKKEFQQFLTYHLNGPALWNWFPWKTEWRVFDVDVKVAGSIDMLYKSPNYTEENKLLIMLDWKRTREIKRENRWETALSPIADLPHANFFQYSLQLNVYKKIIEKNTPYKIEYMGLGVFHPLFDNYQFYEVKPMPLHLEKIWQHRLNQLKK